MAANGRKNSFYQTAIETLNREWKFVGTEYERDETIAFVDDVDLANRISAAVNHDQVSYRFLLPVQVLGKLTEPTLDCRSLQKGGEKSAAGSDWNARSFAAKVIAPWNHVQQDVLGSSDDPYVSNPLRQPRMVKDAEGISVMIEKQ